MYRNFYYQGTDNNARKGEAGYRNITYKTGVRDRQSVMPGYEYPECQFSTLYSEDNYIQAHFPYL